MVIKRFLSDEIFNHIEADFGFLIDKIKKSGFEYDLQIRNNYFNLYYRGNSIGKVSYDINKQLYKVTINYKFLNEKIKKRFSFKKSEAYIEFFLPREQLHSFFSVNSLKSMGQKVKRVNYQEETTFEQMIITDNAGREDFIIIDRQVRDKTCRTQMDLLALNKKEGIDYQFIVLEVKLGNNPELRGKVIYQLKGYINRINDNFEDYKKCYEMNFKQKQELGLISERLKINIVPDILGAVLVCGYSGIAKDSIKELGKKYPEIKVLQFRNIINL